MDDFEITLAAVEVRHKKDGTYCTLTTAQSEITEYLNGSAFISALVYSALARTLRHYPHIEGRDCRITIDNGHEPG